MSTRNGQEYFETSSSKKAEEQRFDVKQQSSNYEDKHENDSIESCHVRCFLAPANSYLKPNLKEALDSSVVR